MNEWEYEIRTEYGKPASTPEDEKQLNVLGEMGWELAAVEGKRWYFKRRKEVYREQGKDREIQGIGDAHRGDCSECDAECNYRINDIGGGREQVKDESRNNVMNNN